MKTMKDFQVMFGSADAGFERSVRRTLNEIGREGNAVRAKMRLGLMFAILLSLLLAAAALAAVASKWGVLDFITRRTAQNTQVLPEATALLQDAESIHQTGGHLKDVDFSVRQAVYDGNQVYMVVEAKEKDSDTMLMDTWEDPTGSMGNLIASYKKTGTTIEAYAQQNGKARILAAGVNSAQGADWSEDSMDVMLEDDGTLIFMLQGSCDRKPKELTVELACSLVPYVKDTDGVWQRDDKSAENGSLSCTLTRSDSALDHVEYVQPMDYPGAGVRVDKVALTVKPMAVYYEIEFTVTNLATYEATEDGVFFEFLSGDGVRIKGGAFDGGVSQVGVGEGFGEETPVIEGSRFIQTGSLTAMQGLPKTVTLRAFNCWERNLYESHEIRLK